MFTREDYIRYFGELAQIERKMVYQCHELIQKVSDPQVISLAEHIGADELRHYSAVMKICDQVFEAGLINQRQYMRETMLGALSLRALEGDNPEIRGHCFNLSKGGMGFECTEKLPLRSLWQIRVEFYGQEEFFSGTGRLLWLKEAEENLFVGGMEFLSR